GSPGQHQGRAVRDPPWSNRATARARQVPVRPGVRASHPRTRGCGRHSHGPYPPRPCRGGKHRSPRASTQGSTESSSCYLKVVCGLIELNGTVLRRDSGRGQGRVEGDPFTVDESHNASAQVVTRGPTDGTQRGSAEQPLEQTLRRRTGRGPRLGAVPAPASPITAHVGAQH